MIIVNSDTRQFNIPGADLVFGVESDAGSERKWFQCPRYVGDNIDLAACFVRMNYRNANGEMDSYLVDDVTIKGDNVEFSWVLSQKAVRYKGQVKFVVCVVGPNQKVEWHTTLGTGMVLEGLEPDTGMVESSTADVVAQLIAMVEAQTAAVEKVGAEQIAEVKAAAKAAETASVAQVEAKGASVLSTIPGDYTAVQNAVRGAANAIRGKVFGEAIRMDDVSPMRHYPAVSVHGKNLIPYPYKQTTSSDTGGTFVVQADGGILASGTPTGYTSLNLYQGVPLVKSGKAVLSCSGVLNNVSLAIEIYDSKENVLFSKETWQNAPPISLDLDLYPSAAKWVVYLKRATPGIEMSGVAYPQLELGGTATEYVPYIDPATIAVNVCGRNMLPYPFYNNSKMENGITFTDNGDGTLTVNGTATDNAFFRFLVDGSMRVKGRYVLSGLSGGSGTSYYIQPFISGVAVRGLTNGSMAYDFDGVLDKITMVVTKGVTLENLRVMLQLEQGDAATNFEMYHGLHFTPFADGVVGGIEAVSPTMTLLTDTPNVNIECEYNRDTNKVIAEILEKITALGG